MDQALNLVLVGMPGCGKTRVGKLVARILGRDFVDLDAEIVRSASMSIPEIFAKFGEARFRELEREEAKKVAARSGLVIATGGGTIVQPGAPEIFRATGKICYIRRPLELLQTAHGRPLSRDRAAVEKLYAERHEKYESAADFTVDNADAPPNQVAQKIAEIFCR
ncbi:MAG: shikimate kinase [Lentisphaeria bacterium]|nr:shikimate kinase [Lentisphaeria bacterium]